VEDIDTPRVVSGSEARILEDLAWLGLTSDEPPVRQSARSTLYEQALTELARQDRVYPCDCSRADIARVASAPHPGEELVYPGTCRDKDPERPLKRDAALRFRVLRDDEIPFTDRVEGPLVPRLVQSAGDFVLRRGDGVYAYQLAVAVDDLAMGITDVVRGVDLLASTPRQLLLMRVLAQEGRIPWAPIEGVVSRYAHVPLVVARDGTRLAKRTPGATVRELRNLGASPEVVMGQLAHGLGLAKTEAPVGAAELATKLGGQEIRFKRKPWPIR
jgi:glutamyl-tRNA synthetase